MAEQVCLISKSASPLPASNRFAAETGFCSLPVRGARFCLRHSSKTRECWVGELHSSAAGRVTLQGNLARTGTPPPKTASGSLGRTKTPGDALASRDSSSTLPAPPRSAPGSRGGSGPTFINQRQHMTVSHERHGLKPSTSQVSRMQSQVLVQQAGFQAFTASLSRSWLKSAEHNALCMHAQCQSCCLTKHAFRQIPGTSGGRYPLPPRSALSTASMDLHGVREQDNIKVRALEANTACIVKVCLAAARGRGLACA